MNSATPLRRQPVARERDTLFATSQGWRERTLASLSSRRNGDSHEVHEVQVGDIIVYGQVDSNGNPQPNWGAGHIAIVMAVTYSDTISYSGGTYYGPRVPVFEPNWGKTYGVHKEFMRRVHIDLAYWDTLGTSTYNPPVWHTFRAVLNPSIWANLARWRGWLRSAVASPPAPAF